MDQPVPPPNRRQFVAWASSAAAIIVAHKNLSAAASTTMLSAAMTADPRILSLELLTAAPLTKMTEFYHQTLGLRISNEKPDRLSIHTGETRLTFVKAAADIGEPFYHFAFNIPENKIAAAWEWQRKRSPLIPIPARLRDPKYPDDVVNYSHWNAHSVFFFDPGGNVVEYIARHDLKNGAEGAFDTKDILYASEIAWVVDDVRATAAKLKEVVGLEQYRNGGDEFMAIGDERGLLLVMRRGRVISFDAKERKAVDVFPTTAGVRGPKRTEYVFDKFPYRLSVDA